MSYICQMCYNRVDTDLDELTEEAINNTLCVKCQEMKKQKKGYPQKSIGDLLNEIEDLKTQKAALLAACKLALEYVDGYTGEQLKSAIEQAGEVT